MHIAVYSGSFNPLHDGHKAILKYLSGRFDGTLLVVSPQNPFKDVSNRDSAGERFAAADAYLRSHAELKARADDIELSMPPPQYTIRTLDMLRKREPGNTFTLAIGADNLPRFREWREYGRILLEYGVIVFPRTGTDAEKFISELKSENPLYRITFASDAPVTDISSTQIRNGEAL